MAKDYRPQERIALMIDFVNLQHAMRSDFPDSKINWSKLLGFFNKQGLVITANVYVGERYAIAPSGMSQDEHNVRVQKFNGFLSWLRHNGFMVRTKPPQVRESEEGRELKCNFDVEITADSMLLVYMGRVDRLVLVSGDSDFAYLLSKLNDFGVRSEVIFSERRTANTLIESCNRFTTLRSLAPEFLDSWKSRGKAAQENSGKESVHGQEAV